MGPSRPAAPPRDFPLSPLAQQSGAPLLPPAPTSLVGALSLHGAEWKRQGASSWLLGILESGFRLLWEDAKPPLSSTPPVPRRMGQEKTLALGEEVRTLLAKGAIERVANPSSGGFYSHLFTVRKANGKLRPVLDLSNLNRFLRRIPFRMETTSSVRSLVRRGDWATSIDLTDAYFHVLIHPSDRKWLRFVWGGVVYHFRALPFGLSLSPWVFSRVVQEFARVVRLQGIRCCVYLDDWLFLALSRELCVEMTSQVLAIALRLGFRINREKSELVPRTSFVYLGMQMDSLAFTVAPKPARLEKLQRLLDTMCPLEATSARCLHRLLGTLESLAPLLPLGAVYRRPLQREVAARWSQASGSWDDQVSLGPWFLEAVRQWQDQEWLARSVPLVLPEPEMEVFTDASMLGWGAHVDDRVASGSWSPLQQTLHINQLELLAVQLGLDQLLQPPFPVLVRVVSDNSTVVAYLMRQGGTASASLSQLAEEVLLSWFHRGVRLTARHLAGVSNVLADALSRRVPIRPTEWTLSLGVLRPIWDRWGLPLVDLFAMQESARLPVFVSPVPDPRALAVDALAISWKEMSAYAFPPFALLPRVLRKVEQDQPCMILIAPRWPARPWFPDLLRLAKEDPIPLNLSVGDLAQPRSGIPHPDPGVFHLHAWRL